MNGNRHDREVPDVSPILSSRRAPIPFVGRYDFRAELLEDLRIEPVTVIGFITYQPFGHIRHESLLNGLADQLY